MHKLGPFRVSPEIESRIDALLREMTLEEQAGQLNMPADAASIPLEDIRSGKVGAAICAQSAYAGNERQESVRVHDLNKIQTIALNESRLGIPLLIGRDVIHGHRTVFPIPLGQATTWNPALIESAAAVAAEEAAASGLRWIFTPMLDIARDARWGRVAEGFGEDPHLCSLLAQAVTRGYQGNDLSDLTKVATSIKHFAGYGAVEGGRDYNSCEITPYTFHNVYLPAFKAAIDAGAATVMAAFTEVGGTPVAANKWLLTDLLKDQWGFGGLVVSDWGAVGELVEHGVAETPAHAAQLALLAGIDLDMATTCFLDHLPDLVRSGQIPEDRLNDAVRRVLRVKFALGLFDNPFTDPELAGSVHLRPTAVQLARETAAASCVLLKNCGQKLPLTPGEGHVAVVGPLAKATGLLFGTWTLDGEPSDVTPVSQALREHGVQVWEAELTDDALSTSRFCQTTVAVVGESPGRSGEDNTVTTLELPPGQTEFIRALRKVCASLVVVVISGRPLDLTEVEANSDALLWVGHPGTEGGRGVADVLVGAAEPGGRLPVTFPRSTGQVPIYYNHKPTGRPLDPFKRGRTRLIDSVDRPLFPFGYGLTYTDFSYTDLRVSSQDGFIEVSAQISNSGERSGTETVQLYIRDLAASYSRPVRELKGFQRIHLEAGEQQQIHFKLEASDLGYFHPDGTFVTEPGKFQVWIGPDSEHGLSAEFNFGQD